MLARILYEDLQAPEVLAGVAPCYMELDEPVESVLVYQRLTASADYATDFNFVRLARSSFKASHYFYLHLAKLPGADPYIQAITRAKEQGSPDARAAFETAAKASAFFQPDLTYAEGVQRWREHPDDAALLYLLSVLSGEQGIAAVEACEERFPESPYLIEMKAQMLASEWRTDEALALYESLGKAHPDFPNLLYDLGMVYRDKKEWKNALDAFQRQLKMHPEDEQCAARISEALLQLSRWKDLGEFLSPWIEPSHQSLWAVLDYADASRNLNTPATKVIKVLAAAEQSYPDSQALHWRLMQLYRAQGDAAQTAKELRLFRALSTTGQTSKSTN